MGSMLQFPAYLAGFYNTLPNRPLQCRRFGA